MNTGADNFMYCLSSCDNGKPLEGTGGYATLADSTAWANDSQPEGWDSRQWLSDLEEMGFLWIDWGKKRIHAERPMLCRSPHNASKAWLLGARTPHFIDDIKSYSEEHGIDFQAQATDEDYPTHIEISGTPDKLGDLATKKKLHYCKDPHCFAYAMRKVWLSDFIGKKELDKSRVDDYCQESIPKSANCLKDNAMQLFNNHMALAMDSRIFNPATLRFNLGRDEALNGAFALVQREQYGMQHSLFLTGGNQKDGPHEDPVRRQCPGVGVRVCKYLCLSQAKKKLGVRRKGQSMSVYVPKYCPLPLPLGRALAMSSGRPPTRETLGADPVENLGFAPNEMEFLCYKDVPKVMARLVSKRLGMEMKHLS